jgi:hypothetical protein
MVYVCKSEDAFLEDKTVWFVDLTNGERIWMDDDRPGTEPRSAWLRLGMYVNENKLGIKQVCLKFRSHLECPLPANAAGYFFAKKAIAITGWDGTMTSYLVGHFQDGLIHVQEWSTPELLQQRLSTRKPSDLELPECLIMNPGYNVLPTPNS